MPSARGTRWRSFLGVVGVVVRRRLATHRRPSALVAGRPSRERRAARGLRPERRRRRASRATAAPGTRTRCSSAPRCSPSRCRRSSSTSTGSCPTPTSAVGRPLAPLARMVRGVARRLRRHSCSRGPGGIDAARKPLRAPPRARDGGGGSARARRAPDRVPALAPAREERGPAPASRVRADVARCSGSSGGMAIVLLGDRGGASSERVRRRRPLAAPVARRRVDARDRRDRSSLLARPVAYRPIVVPADVRCSSRSRSWHSSRSLRRNALRPLAPAAPPTGRRRSWEAGQRSPP